MKLIGVSYWNVSALLLLLLSLNMSGCTSGCSYEGDGTMESGFLIYPTFRIIFSQVPVAAGVSKAYRFDGVPSDELSLRLKVVIDTGQQELTKEERSQTWEALSVAKPEIKVTLIGNGEELVSVGPGELTKSWVFAASGGKYYFWHEKFSDLILSPDKKYNLVITLSTHGDLAMPISLQPVLEGGGFGKGEIYRP